MKKDILKGKKTLKADLDYIDQVSKKVVTNARRNLMDVPVKNVQIKYNTRGDKYINIEELADSIESEKLIEPIIVMKEEDRKYTIICGHRRYKAHLELIKKHGEESEYTKIEAIVYEEKLSDEQIEYIQLIENIQREDIEPVQLKIVFEKLKARGLTLKEISKKIGKSEGYVKNISMTIAVLNKNEELKSIVESQTGVTLTDIQIVKALPNKQQIDLITQKAEGKIKSRRDLQEKVWSIREEMYSENKTYREEREKNKYNIINHNVKFKGIKVKSFHIDEEELTFDDATKLKDQLEEIVNRVSSIIKTKFSTDDTDNFLQEGAN